MNSALFYKTLRENFPFEPTLKQDIFFQKMPERTWQRMNTQGMKQARGGHIRPH
jgi:hypothetical protein